MGSVKDLMLLEKPLKNKSGRGRFVFSDRYSVFDWGEMPDHIENKGKSLCISAAYFFEKLETMGIKTHYQGLIENGKLNRLVDIKEPVEVMEVKLIRVLQPQPEGNFYNYSIYKNENNNFLIPLEIIYRTSLPEGSSVFKRLREGSLKLKSLSLKEMPLSGQTLNQPFLDVSTKLESSDRYLNWKEAKEMVNFKDDDIKEIKRITLLVNKLITEEVEKIGLKYEDGKIEFGFDEKRNLLLVDVLGTLDECRFTFDGIPVSKEIARIFYRKTSWYQEISEVKKKDKLNWKNKVDFAPPPLPPDLRELITMAYCAFTNEITGRKWFKNIPSMQKVLEETSRIINRV